MSVILLLIRVPHSHSSLRPSLNLLVVLEDALDAADAVTKVDTTKSDRAQVSSYAATRYAVK